jgi:ribosomal protein L12E/L44/L45/RPP1/RPP2
VSRADCPLVRLTLQSADVDDAEADRFVQCLCSNQNLLELDLSSNLLGTAEASSNGDTTVKTGGVSLAEFITSASCKLQVLKVSWNSIRLRSAVRLAEAVAFNHTLTHLDLSCNGMGFAAGEALGDAIMENRTLRTLLVANNNFTSTACLSLCVGVVENLAIKHLSLNDNPIGRAGASMIMQTSIVLGSRVRLTAQSCNTISIDERCWYDPGMPCRDYELHLNQPFHRAVAFHLLQTVATHSTLIFADFSYEAPGSNGRATKMKMVQSMSKDREKYFDEEQRHILKGLRLMLDAASNSALGTKLFYEADEDNSGRLDKDELQNVLDKIGFTIDSDRLQDILAVFDVDGAGTIDLSEFQSLLKSQHHEVAMRIREMLQYPILATSTHPTVKYVPPRTGILRCSVVDGFVRKKDFYTITAVDQKYAFQMAKGIGDVLMMTDAVRNSKMRMNEAYAMYKMMYKEVGDKAEVLVKVLPQMMYPHEARQLVSKVTHDERVQLARLKAAFSVAVRPMFGAYNGYYCLDLSKELHRVCFARLLEQSQTVNAAKASRSIIAYGKAGDTSQHGNWTSFRNEFRNGQPVQITAQLFTPMPQSGILEFDFSGGLRPTGSELRLTDRRMCKVLQNLCLLEEGGTVEAMRRLHSWQRRAREKSQDGQLFMPMYRFSVEKALETGRYTDLFYENLPERRGIMRHASRREDIKVNFMKMNKDDAKDFAEAVQQIASKLADDVEHPADSFASAGDSDQEEDPAKDGEGQEDDEAGEDGDTFDLGIDAFVTEVDDEVGESPAETAPAVTGEGEEQSQGSMPEAAMEDLQLYMRQKKIKETKHRLHTLLHAKRGVSKHAKASRFVEAVEEAFQQLWILSRHLALLVVLFQELFEDVAKTKYFGSYAADIVVLLYSRVVDLHNFEIVWEVLSAQDCACVVGRIGLLNVFNPMKPDVTMELDLRRREERMVAKMIVYLSVDEPGINLNYKRFQWKRELDPIPGWDVTEPWFTEEGLPQHGKFAFTYYSGEGRNRNGCIPNVKLRKALCHLTLIDENEIIDENAMLPDELACTALQHFEENSKVWLEYLVPSADPGKRH